MKGKIIVIVSALLALPLCMANAQDAILTKKVKLEEFQGTKKEFLKHLESKTNISFSYTNEILVDEIVHIEKSEKTLNEYLDQIFPDHDINYHVQGNKILLLKNSGENQGGLLQKIRGVVLDKDSESPLIGATILVSNTSPVIGTISNANGEFVLENVPVGRCEIEARFIGYKPAQLSNLILKSVKELVLTIELEENVEEIEEVVISIYENKGDALNKMAIVGARAFSVEQTERYAGSWGDPSRMATNFAGVITAGDQMNDIVIRGNSPTGLLWNFEGIPIPSPNHFDAMGATGGPVSILNNNVLSRSDFFTGAFPSEFGNGISGVFDLNMRNGNNEKREYVAQLGFNGFEVGAEGPFSPKNKASFLVNYRYSMLGLVDQLLWIDELPYYQDLSFKMNIPYAKGNISVFGLGGLSHIYFNYEDSATPENPVKIGSTEKDGSKTGVVGAKWVHFFDNDLRMVNTVAVTTRRPFYDEDSLINGHKAGKWGKSCYTQDELLYSAKLIKKFNARNTVEIGSLIEDFTFSSDRYVNYFRPSDSLIAGKPYNFSETNIILLQNYLQWKHKFTPTITFVGGLHHMQLFLNNSKIVEPRAAIQWQVKPKQSISLGYGLHSQIQPLHIYFIPTYNYDTEGNFTITNESNKNLEFSKSHQFVLGYNYSITKNLRLKVETYYQYLYDYPVEARPSIYSMINEGANFGVDAKDSLINRGTGKNYGIEFTFEKYFNNDYYVLLTTSLFDSKYKGSDDIERNTVYNGNYVINLLGGYEWQLKGNWSMNADIRMVLAGGRRVIPVLEQQSKLENYTVYDYDNAYTQKVGNYFRLDPRIGFTYQGKKTTHEIALDITNVTNHLNPYEGRWDNISNKVVYEYQQGIFPMGLYRINF